MYYVVMHSPFHVLPEEPSIFVTFDLGQHHAVLRWLIVNLTEGCSLTASNLAAVDSKGRYRWRMSKSLMVNRVLFHREEDAQLFSLAWA